MMQESCTIYNKYTDSQGEHWIRTCLEGVYWDGARGAVTRRVGVVGGDSVLALIPACVRSDGKGYLPPKVWERTADKAEYFTIRPGDKMVRGICTEELIDSSAPLESYDDTITVTAVNLRRCPGDMAHLEVRGKEYLWSLR